MEGNTREGNYTHKYRGIQFRTTTPISWRGIQFRTAPKGTVYHNDAFLMEEKTVYDTSVFLLEGDKVTVYDNNALLMEQNKKRYLVTPVCGGLESERSFVFSLMIAARKVIWFSAMVSCCKVPDVWIERLIENRGSKLSTIRLTSRSRSRDCSSFSCFGSARSLVFTFSISPLAFFSTLPYRRADENKTGQCMKKNPTVFKQTI